MQTHERAGRRRTGKPSLYVVINNHFDLTWRRCWNRRFTWNGQEYASYADIQDAYMAENLALARRHPGYKFMTECTAVARKFIERHPEKLPELKRLAAAGRFEVGGAGDNVVDGNLALGESLARNFVTGFLWLEQHLGQRMACAVRNDAFGNSAQLPQILRQCGLRLVTGITYSELGGEYWRGLDGSTVCGRGLPRAGILAGYDKYPPCPHCHGKGCRRCRQRGFDQKLRARLTPFDKTLIRDKGRAYIELSPEELLPNPAVFDWLRQEAGEFAVRFAVESDFVPLLGDRLARVDALPARELHPSLEVNPNNTGCYVTRIRLKQRLRRAEYALLGAETLAAAAATRGAAWPRAELALAWEKLLFTTFHDAITGTHVDAAYTELMDIYAEIDTLAEGVAAGALRKMTVPRRGALSVVNPTGFSGPQIVAADVPLRGAGARVEDAAGQPLPTVAVERLSVARARVTFVAPALAPMSAATFRYRPGPPPAKRALGAHRIENARFRIEADEQGVRDVYDKLLGRTLLTRGAYRPFELILEEDEGSPWATIKPSMERCALSGRTKLLAAGQCGAQQSLRFETDMNRLANHSGARAWTTVTLTAGIERVDVATEVEWRACNMRLRVAMPVPAMGRHLYGIPYGTLERPVYEPWFDWKAAGGDWPAINWAGVEAPGFSVAALNRGLPSYRIEPADRNSSTILISLLRSPAYPTYLHEPESYTMTDYDGMRDEGRHRLEYAVTGYEQPLLASRVEADAQLFNAGLRAVAGEVTLPDLPAVESDHVYAASFKVAEEGDALVLRLAEYRGCAGRLRVRLPAAVRSAERVNLLERDGCPVPVRGGVAELDVRPWEIVTLRLERA